MTSTKESRARRIIRQVRKRWAELDYAQRRMFEVRTGIPAATKRTGQRARGRRKSQPPQHA